MRCFGVGPRGRTPPCARRGRGARARPGEYHPSVVRVGDRTPRPARRRPPASSGTGSAREEHARDVSQECTAAGSSASSRSSGWIPLTRPIPARNSSCTPRSPPHPARKRWRSRSRGRFAPPASSAKVPRTTLSRNWLPRRRSSSRARSAHGPKAPPVRHGGKCIRRTLTLRQAVGRAPPLTGPPARAGSAGREAPRRRPSPPAPPRPAT